MIVSYVQWQCSKHVDADMTANIQLYKQQPYQLHVTHVCDLRM